MVTRKNEVKAKVFAQGADASSSVKNAASTVASVVTVIPPIRSSSHHDGFFVKIFWGSSLGLQVKMTESPIMGNRCGARPYVAAKSEDLDICVGDVFFSMNGENLVPNIKDNWTLNLLSSALATASRPVYIGFYRQSPFPVASRWCPPSFGLQNP
jgi:hypothetical protein